MAEWTEAYHKRQQHCFSRMNHHIHPLVNSATGTRRPLQSCLAKGKQVCKYDFPLENQMTDKSLLVCRCIAEHMGLSTTGPRSFLGTVLPARNDADMNAGPRALVTFTGSNGDIKFPYRLPILQESHEVLLFDMRTTTPCYRPGDVSLQAMDLQCAMSVVAGYFGGYTSKMQDIGQKEVKRLGVTVDRQLPSVIASRSAAQVFQYYSRRLVRDLEAKGNVRTAVESTLLSLHSDDKDVLMAECIRTFPSVTFPALLLLKREEVECGKTPGASMITNIFHGHGKQHLMFTEAPFDLMYGFRGTSHKVNVLSPYEMLLHWSITRIGPPSASSQESRSQWTAEGREYLKECKQEGVRPACIPGVHYAAIEDDDSRILMPECPHLKGLRHCWCWEKRRRVHLPIWSCAKMPSARFSPE